MKLGLFLMPLHRPGRLHGDTYEENLDLMAYADRKGAKHELLNNDLQRRNYDEYQ